MTRIYLYNDDHNDFDLFIQKYNSDVFKSADGCRTWLLQKCHTKFGQQCYLCGSCNTKIDEGCSYNCRTCQRTFSLTYGTIMQRSSLSLPAWFELAGRIATRRTDLLRIMRLVDEYGTCYRAMRGTLGRLNKAVDADLRVINFSCQNRIN